MGDHAAEHVWVLDRSKSVSSQIERLLGDYYGIRTFTQLEALRKAAEKSEARSFSPLLIIRAEKPDSVVSDFMRHRRFMMSFLVVSECNDLGTILSCLEMGASDYFLYPVDANLLAAKVMHHLRCLEAGEGSGLIFDAFSLFIRNSAGNAAKLTPKEFQLLSTIEMAYPALVTREELRTQVWGRPKVVTKTLDVHVFKLRKKLETLGFEIIFREDRYGIARKRSSR